jgi:hypothetical protein
MASITTCPKFVSHPHSGCYECRMAYSSEGINPIADELEALGIKNEIHQTGGFCMCIFINMGGTSFIYASEEGFSYFKDEEDDGSENHNYFGDDFLTIAPKEKAQLIAKWIKENN